MTRVRFIALSNEVHHILICGREGQILSENWLDILCSNHLTVALIEKSEAFFSLFVFASLRADTLVPVIGDNMFNEGKIDGVSSENFRVTFLELFFDVTRSHLMKAEVLQNISEEIIGNGEFSFFKIVVEAVLEIREHLGRQVAIDGCSAFWGLGNVFLDRAVISFFSCFVVLSHI